MTDFIKNKARTLGENVLSCTKQWEYAHERGMPICKIIRSLRCHEIVDIECRLPILKNTMFQLDVIIKAMRSIVNNLQFASNECSALSKLVNSTNPILKSWSIVRTENEIRNIFKMYDAETKLKNIVKESIAHCEDENSIEFFLSMWEYNTQIKLFPTHCLAEELGHNERQSGFGV